MNIFFFIAHLLAFVLIKEPHALAADEHSYFWECKLIPLKAAPGTLPEMDISQLAGL